MCGICGIININNTPVKEELVRDMCRAFSHRGPDDEGYYINCQPGNNKPGVGIGLGHKRLSILDLSQAGHQPMSNEDGSIWLTYNGEIYNFKELREELRKKGHIFKSESDTEVIIHLYEEEGVQAVEKLNGMFAFALWDFNRSRFWMCRDRIGIKPLVYYWDGQHFVFASEIKALLKDPDISRELDYESLNFYLAHSYIPAPRTIFSAIRKLEPGFSLVLENGQLEISKYWDAPCTIDSEFSSLIYSTQVDQYKKLLYESLSDAVIKRMISDVPLGAFLSGGIDSSIIVALMAKHSKEPVRTFSIGFKDAKLFDETSYAREVAALYKTDHHEFKLAAGDMLDILSEVLSFFDEPFSDSSAIPTYIVSRETKKHVTVALSGDGGDELFAGYRSYLGQFWFRKYMMVPALLREHLIEKAVNWLPDSRDKRSMEYFRRLKKFIKGTKGSFSERVFSLKEIFPRDIRLNILSASTGSGNRSQGDACMDHMEQRLRAYKDDELNSILYSDLKDSLPGDMLTKVDWMSMKHSLEVRVPFLDHRVVELAFGMQSALKIHRGTTKYILKETFKDILPKSLYRRPKAGFEVPISQWLKKDLKFLLPQYLSEDRIQDQGIFDYGIVENLIQKHITGRTDTSWMLWNLIVFQYWHDEYLS